MIKPIYNLHNKIKCEVIELLPTMKADAERIKAELKQPHEIKSQRLLFSILNKIEENIDFIYDKYGMPLGGGFTWSN